MSQVILDKTQIHPGFDQMYGIGMTQVPYRDRFINFGLFAGLFKGNLNARVGQWLIREAQLIMASAWCRE